MMTSFMGILVIALVTLFSIVLHEVAHGLVAYFFKDKTAYAAGGLTLNPIPHIDVIGSILVPTGSFLLSGTLFGWAKPVPVNPRNLVGRYADFWVSAAGVLTNLLLVAISFILSYFLADSGLLTEGLRRVLYAVLVINLSLALFNLIPIPPFDGMSILQGLFPKLRINTALVYNPMYMIVAIVTASYVYSKVSPVVFQFVLGSF